ncbi:MAG TPA: response regulator transcription factor [Solirubrobacteraceae bacterium]|jgi:DNA-binding NarL/FixJ family response regulator|nr:response regulator transcription factor [Solirubrobacteraceae bacterium]
MDERGPVTVLLARFEDLIEAGLRSLIGEDPNLQVVAWDISPDDLSAALSEHRPRVAIVNLGALRAPADIRRVSAAHPMTRLIVLGSHPRPAQCAQLLALGATACLSTDIERRDVLNAIHLVSRGMHVLPYAGSEHNGTSLLRDALTLREADVLQQLQLGRSNGEIAVALSVSVETVRTHVRSVFRKLGVKGRRELATTSAIQR